MIAATGFKIDSNNLRVCVLRWQKKKKDLEYLYNAKVKPQMSSCRWREKCEVAWGDV